MGQILSSCWSYFKQIIIKSEQKEFLSTKRRCGQIDFEKLSTEMLLEIIKHLDTASLVSLSYTCRTLSQALNLPVTEILWPQPENIIPNWFLDSVVPVRDQHSQALNIQTEEITCARSA